MLYTVVPHRQIYKEILPEYQYQEEELSAKSRLVSIENGGGRYVKRLISTDMNDYLDQRYQPDYGAPVWINNK